MRNIIVSPSILSADFSNIVNDVEEINKSGATWVHLDVMDGFFVPNITFGPKFIKDLKPHSNLIFDTHLMIVNPEKYIKEFAEVGSNYITIHTEACKKIPETLNLIKSYGCKAGVSINPETNVSEVFPYLDMVDLILIMTVHPGFGGQSFIYDCMEKVKSLSEVRGNRNYLISVDGGINLDTAQIAIENGVDVLVSGSAYFKANNKKEFVKSLQYSD